MTPSASAKHCHVTPLQPALVVLSNGCLALLCASQLFGLYSGNTQSLTLSSAALVAFICLQWSAFSRREHLLVSASVALTVLAYWRLDFAGPALLAAVHKAAFLAAFMMLLATLREGASRSPSVTSLGRWVSSRPPGRRYISISVGAQMLGILLNFGALNLLGPLLAKGAQSSANSAVREWRLRRQLVAMGQGFAWLIAWSPTAVTGATAAAVISASQPLYISSIGFVAAFGAVLIGWLFDKHLGGIARAALGQNSLPADFAASKLPVQAAQRFALLCGALIALSILVVFSFKVALIPALMLCSPLVSLLWLELQQRRQKQKGRASALLLLDGFRSGATDALVLACGGYMGLVMATLVDAPWLAEQLALQDWPAALIYCLVMAIIPLLSNLAIPPILSVTFIGSVLNAAALQSIDANLLASALVIGWVLNLNGSVFGIASMINSRVSGHTARELAWGWHGVLSLLTWFWCSLLLILLSLL